ncbi:MAG: hypothetical protein Q4G58_07250 [bacterium]|nr:hypothetical protein [bacterium]
MQNNDKRMSNLGIVLLGLALVYGVIFNITGFFPWSDAAGTYNSYSLQAQAWLEGRLDLGQNYSYLELAIYGGKYYVSFPPFPSFIFYILGLLTHSFQFDGLVAMISTLLGAYYLMEILYSLNKKHVAFWTLFLMVASNLVFVSSNGWVWFIAQNLSFTLSVMAIYYAMQAKGGLSFFFWACSVGCRPFQVIYFPMLVYIIYRKWKQEHKEDTLVMLVKKKLYWAVPTLIIAGVYMWLNYARFGSIFEFGHNYLPEFTESELGQFNISYIFSNFSSIFRLAEYNNGTFSYCKFNGMAIWVSMPIYITYVMYLLYFKGKKQLEDTGLIKMHLVLMLVHVLLILSHKTLGGWQFGNRYFIDLLPYLFYVLMKTTPNEDDPIYNYQIILFIFGLTTNILGTIATYQEWL